MIDTYLDPTEYAFIQNTNFFTVYFYYFKFFNRESNRSVLSILWYAWRNSDVWNAWP